jgi:hypothetical protein
MTLRAGHGQHELLEYQDREHVQEREALVNQHHLTLHTKLVFRRQEMCIATERLRSKMK